jgi:selenocysteine lyase/cysteine desulfurase
MRRRDILTGGAGLFGALAGGVGAGCTAQTRAVTPPSAGRDRWQDIRSEFELEPGQIYLAGLLLASHPRAVRAAIDAHRRGLDRSPADYIHAIGYEYGAQIRTSVVAYTGGEPQEVALTDSTTMGLGLLYGGMQLGPQDDILHTTHDHFVTDTALAFASARSGARVRKVALYDESAQASAGSMTERLVSKIVPETRVVAVTWVHSSTGVKLPLPGMAAAIGEINRQRPPEQRIAFCVDGVHGFGVEDVHIPDLGCDFFSAGCHKWIFGPRGTGILWGRRSAWPRVRPTIPPFEAVAFDQWLGRARSAEPPSFGEMMTPGGFHSFEHRWALPEAFRFHLDLGKARVQERIHALSSELKAGLAELKNVRLHTPSSPEISSGIVCFEVAGLDAEATVKKLHDRGIVGSTTPYAVSYARLTPGIFNTSDDVKAAVRALAEMT